MKVILIGTRRGRPAIHWPGVAVIYILATVGGSIAGLVVEVLWEGVLSFRPAMNVVIIAHTIVLILLWSKVRKCRAQPTGCLPPLDSPR